MKRFLQKRWIFIAFIVVFVFSLTFPYTCDDLVWSLKDLSLYSFIDIIKNPHLNGRYIGSLFALLMTRNKVLRGLIVSGCLVGIVALIKKETKVSNIVIWLLLLVMPIEVFAQGVVWTSAFANYVVSTFLLLVCLMRIRDAYNKEFDLKNSCINFILFIISSLFIENVTVFLLGLTIILNVIYFIKNKKVNLNLIGPLVGSCIGTSLMFIHPAYRSVLNSTDTYRTLDMGIGSMIAKIFKNYNFTIYKYVAFSNVALISVLNLSLLYYYRKNNKKCSKAKKDLLNLSFILTTIFTIYALLYRIFVPVTDVAVTKADMINAPLTFCFLITFITQLCVLFYKKEALWKLVMPLLIIVSLVAPLTVVTPIGSRNFFLIYVLEVIEVAYILQKTGLDMKKYKYVLLTILIIILGIYISIYYYISDASSKRDEYVIYVSNETTDTNIEVPILPFSKFVHFPNYGNDKYWKKIYTDYLKVRDDLYFIYVPYKEWKNEFDR